MNFEFDPQKSASNKAKHGIDFVEAQQLWTQPINEVSASFRGEMRYVVTGLIDKDYWSAVITYRGAVRRIVSVRRAVDSEVQNYEQKFNSDK